MIITFVAVDIDSMLLIFLPTFVYIRNIKFSYLNEIPQKFNPELKKIALATFFLSIMVWLGLAIDYNISLF